MKSIGILTLLICLSGAAFSADRPNIILMMGDDHGWEETGYNGHPYVKTPVLDEMAASGLNLENFYASHASCSPTRAAFMTGRHPNRMGTFSPGWSLRPEEVTFAHLLQNAGYRTAHFGKWHIGAVKASSPVNPGAMGFDEWLSHDNFFEMNPTFSRNGDAPKIYPGESSEILIRETIDFINSAQQSDEPFLAVIWFGSPHEPYSGLPEDLALYDNLPEHYAAVEVKLTSNQTGNRTTRPQRDVLRERFAEITAMDRSIGDLREHLAKVGLRDNTLVFYCGDNGTSGESSIYHPRREAKGSIYDGGTAVPGVIEWPARIPHPRRSAVRASTSDLLPTLAALVDAPLPDHPIDGIDLTPLLDGQMQERTNPLYFWQYADRGQDDASREPYIDPELQKGTTPLVKYMRGLRTRNFLNYRFETIVDADYRGRRSIIDGDWKLIIHEDEDAPEVELFNLDHDPAETVDLSDKYAARVRHLRSKLKNWQHSVLNSLTGADY
ncbi:MAG: sulfatase-like hydrolase/transferase [Synoicihabitans sp.]